MSSNVMNATSGQRGVAENANPNAPGSALQQKLSKLASNNSVHQIFSWFAAHQRQISDWQIDVTRIPAPMFGESMRAEWMRARFEELGLQDVHLDVEGNVFGIRPGTGTSTRYVLLCAHMDTVFPEGTALEVQRNGDKLLGPGISDNGAGLAALLALAGALRDSELKTESSLLFVANVGEEGEGDLRGVRHLFADPRWKDLIEYTIVLDGGGIDGVVTEGLGSRRFQVTVRGPGGHSWSDFGTPNPIAALARVIEQFSRTSVPVTPKTTFNFGMISGGTSVNSIPESASVKIDIRSSSPTEMDRVERALRASIERVLVEYRDTTGSRKVSITGEVKAIGNRPAAELRSDAQILRVVRAVDERLQIRTRVQRASTDANIPLSLGKEAVTLGAGGTGGGAHTLHEWYDPANREVGLKRILLSLLMLAGVPQ